MFRRLAIKLYFFQFRIYVYIKTLTKKYLPNCIYEYVFINPPIQHNRGINQTYRNDGEIQEISGEETTEERRRARNAGNTYETFTPKSERITRRKSLNDIQGMLKGSSNK